ncbi:MAG: alanine--tRNA ligase-related protein [Verrucomicrobiota bacterium]
MTAAQIRQSFLDFFKSKQHTIVPSASLMPDSPNLLFTNAGMNQFVPIFLGQVECPYKPGRAADTQKCIRAGGKHNDLDDVGLDTYHHTFFEMLGNWSFGDYFKKESIAWAWELIIDVWKFPAERVYATIYQPDKSKGDPAERDQEAWELWAEKFRSAGLDPEIHIVDGNKKDNFWMMGDTGPCGPCTEIHVDLTPGPVRTGLERQKEGALLVNGPDSRCIEIWNNVFIQYNANPDGSFVPLPAQHVDTGMGFERVVSIIHGTKNFTDFETAKISNYATDVFRPLFDEIEKLSGKKYLGTMPAHGTTGETEQEKIDIAFRVIADHIRTLSFSIADGITPGNNDRNYVLRRILRRAVKYGRTLGFTEPFFYKLTDTLAAHMGDIFPELRARKEFVKQTLKTEEEAFNRTLDKGITLFEEEADRLRGSTRAPRVDSGAPPESLKISGNAGTFPSLNGLGATYSRRNLPHFERPWAKYMITFSAVNRRPLTSSEKDIVLESILTGEKLHQYHLYAACVMTDHVHLLIEPSVKRSSESEEPAFYSLAEILQPLKSSTAHRINKLNETSGPVWDKESFDRMIRSDSDLEEKYLYIVRNPEADGLVKEGEKYAWVVTCFDGHGALEIREHGGERSAAPPVVGNVSGEAPETTRGGACAPLSCGQITGAFAFRLYDEQGFPFDLTELMARERGLTVDKEGFEKLMEEQRARARAAQKKSVIKLSEIETKEATNFLGYDAAETETKVLEVVNVGDKTAVIVDATPCYAEMGGQLGDTGAILHGAEVLPISNTQKSGNTFLHYLDQPADGEDGVLLTPGTPVTVRIDGGRRAAISRHHSVTHLLHWALHEVVSPDATQKGSFVGPDKLTFDFNSAALTPQQVAEVEKLVNERIVENAPISWQEFKYADVKSRPEIMQAFGEKYGESVRVVQIGGEAGALNGYSMELCGGTHVRGTGEIGLFRIVSEAATGAGIRRIEAVAGLSAYEQAAQDASRLKALAAKIGAPLPDLEKKLDSLLEQTKTLEKALKAAQQREAATRAKELLSKAEGNVLIANLGDQDGDYAMAVSDALKSLFNGVVVLGASGGGNVALIATVSKEHQARVQAGKIISAIAPLVGGKGGGKPDFARGGGKDVSGLEAALAEARKLAPA